ncbi:hypothetical protein QA635_31670 [Bradyrhizobium brasilense]|uniref:hypothetical protein n=1 Tax=Bradyrhizobium brasilense TaxID=1419277 RepID=UPI0024B07FC4|nr:hypothetical protein [Bradyrhizobium australafricanum]WFU31096.1 hypothetical protein QA635_31670 [Bradyrhizobium australafricanum]
MVCAAGEALIREADDPALPELELKKSAPTAGPVDASPSIDQAIKPAIRGSKSNARGARHRARSRLAALRHVPTTNVRDLAGRLRCVKCSTAGKRPAAELLQLWRRCPTGDAT